MYDVRRLWPGLLLIAVAATARPKMGGVLTWAWLTTWDMNLTPEGSHLTRGIFWEYYQALGLSFDLEEAINKLTWHVYRERLVGSTTNAPLSKVLIENGRNRRAGVGEPAPRGGPRSRRAPARSSMPPTTRTWPPPPACPSCSAAPARAASPGCRRRV